MQVLNKDPSNYMGNSNGYVTWDATFLPVFHYSMIVDIKGILTYYCKIQAYLIFVDLSNNNFRGTIPETVGSLKQLRLLNFSNNVLTGAIPLSLAKLTNLEALDLF